MNQFTEKDVAYITDMFSWNLQALKLANHFMEEAEDKEVVELFEEIINMHYDNLNKCIAILGGEIETASQQEEEFDEDDEEMDDEEEEEDA